MVVLAEPFERFRARSLALEFYSHAIRYGHGTVVLQFGLEGLALPHEMPATALFRPFLGMLPSNDDSILILEEASKA